MSKIIQCLVGLYDQYPISRDFCAYRTRPRLHCCNLFANYFPWQRRVIREALGNMLARCGLAASERFCRGARPHTALAFMFNGSRQSIK